MQDYKELFTNLKIKYDNLVTKFNEREKKHKDQIQSLEKVIDDIRIQRNAFEKELVHQMKLYNEEYNKYEKEKELNQVLLDQTEENSTVFNPDLFLLNLNLIKDHIYKTFEHIDDFHLENITNENFHIHKIDKAMDDLFQEGCCNLFFARNGGDDNDIFKKEWEEIGGNFYEFWDSIEKKKKQLDNDIEFKSKYKSFKKSEEIYKKTDQIIEIIKDLQNNVLDDLIELQFIDNDTASSLFDKYCKDYIFMGPPKKLEKKNDNN